MQYEMQHRTCGGTMCLSDSPLKTLCLFAATLVDYSEHDIIDRDEWRLMELPKNGSPRPFKVPRKLRSICVSISRDGLGMLNRPVSFYEAART